MKKIALVLRPFELYAFQNLKTKILDFLKGSYNSGGAYSSASEIIFIAKRECV